MRVNVEKVLERDQKLSELDNRAGTYLTFFYNYSKFVTMTYSSKNPTAVIIIHININI